MDGRLADAGFADRIRAVDPDRVWDVARRWFHVDRRVEVVVRGRTAGAV